MMYSITIMISKIFLTMHNAHYRHYGSGGKYTTFLVVERERETALGSALHFSYPENQ